MFTYKAFLFLLMLSVAKSEVDFETTCKNDYRNIDNSRIDVWKYCSDHLCIEKCCGKGEMFSLQAKCKNKDTIFQNIKKFTLLLVQSGKKAAKLASEVDYSKITLFSWDGTTKTKSEKDFVFVINHRDVNNCTVEHDLSNDFFILEDGSLRMQNTGRSKVWSDMKRLEYCIDFKLTVINGTLVVKLVVREYFAQPKDEAKKSIFVLVGLVVSSFFLILVLVVYCLLPKLQNLIGLVMIAYTASILVTFLVKIVIHVSTKSLTVKHCKIIGPMLYFAALSSFFWLNVMSFDVWWSLRGHRKRCDINRRGEWVKFMWYCLYAWGTPLLITAIVIALDNIDLSNLDIIKPPFEDCFVYPKSVELYLTIPIGVIIFVNIILFLLTVYNIWMIRRAVARCQDSGSSEQDTNRFATYIKLSVIMGVNWCLELIPIETKLWLFILTNTYNLLIGVTIFFLFVFNKRILLMLCRRFNINNDFTKRLEVSQGTKRGVQNQQSPHCQGPNS